jgi:hypothetical protein
MKKTIAATMALTALVFAVITGCGKDDKEINKIVEPDTIKYYRSIIDTTHTPGMQRSAHFMICYMYFYKIKDNVRAKENVIGFLKKYPDEDPQGTREAAQIMLQMLEPPK